LQTKPHSPIPCNSPTNLSRVHNFHGTEFLSEDEYDSSSYFDFEWGSVEKQKNVFDFTELDLVVSEAAKKNKYIMLEFKDRTFGGGCSSNFVPSYIKKVGNVNKPNFCTAAIWESATMSEEIRVINKILDRYRNNSRVLGVFIPETALAIDKGSTASFSFEGYKAQLIRAQKEIHAANSNMLVVQRFNFPQESEKPGFMSGLGQALHDLGASGGIGWPDTAPAQFNTWDHFQMAREYNNELVIAPSVQTPQIKASDTDILYDFLVNDVQAHMIGWNHYHKDMSDYVQGEIIPTVNARNGYIKNTKCPFSSGSGGSVTNPSPPTSSGGVSVTISASATVGKFDIKIVNGSGSADKISKVRIAADSNQQYQGVFDFVTTSSSYTLKPSMSLDGQLASYVEFNFGTIPLAVGASLNVKTSTLSKTERLVNGTVTITYENGSVTTGKLVQQGASYIFD
jgi:hypothetical protein